MRRWTCDGARAYPRRSGSNSIPSSWAYHTWASDSSSRSKKSSRRSGIGQNRDQLSYRPSFKSRNPNSVNNICQSAPYSRVRSGRSWSSHCRSTRRATSSGRRRWACYCSLVRRRRSHLNFRRWSNTPSALCFGWHRWSSCRYGDPSWSKADHPRSHRLSYSRSRCDPGVSRK